MRNKSGVIIFMMVLFLLPVCAQATPIVKDFYTNGQIIDGNNFDGIKLHDSVTVEMYGGNVGVVTSELVSTFNMYGGTIGSIAVMSYANLYGGSINTIVGFGEVNIYGYDFVWTLGEIIPQ